MGNSPRSKVSKCQYHLTSNSALEVNERQVPGTVNLNEVVDSTKLEDWEYEEPKKRGDIVLQPQPTDSLNDPLNWSTGTKMAILFIVSLTAGVTVS